MLDTLEPDGFDINMGCSSSFVMKKGAGAALLTDLKKTCSIIKEIRKNTDKPITVKIRLMPNYTKRKILCFIKTLIDEGVNAITVHPRTPFKRYSGKPDWEIIGYVSENTSIPIIGNGDLFTVDSALKAWDKYKPAALMIGRGVIQNPWLFRLILNPKSIEPDFPFAFNKIVEGLKRDLPKDRRLGRLKEFTSYLARNYAFGHLLQCAIQNSSTINVAQSIANAFFLHHKPRKFYYNENI